MKGVTRCIKRMGLFHGDDVTTRYRRLDMRLHAHQDRRVDRGLPQQGRIGHAALARPISRQFVLKSEPPVHHRDGIGADRVAV